MQLITGSNKILSVRFMEASMAAQDALFFMCSAFFSLITWHVWRSNGTTIRAINSEITAETVSHTVGERNMGFTLQWSRHSG